MSIFNDKALKGVAEAAAKIMAETSHGSTPKTDKEKSLAALAHPKDKITHKDVLVGRGVIKKEEVELHEETEQLQEYESKGGVFRHSAKLEKGSQYGSSDYSKGGEEEKEAKKLTSSPKRAQKGYGPRQNTGMRGLSIPGLVKADGSKVKKEELSFTDMLELYNEHGLKVLAPIETEEMDIDDTKIEVLDADKVNGFVETIVEEPTNDEFTKEFEDQKASFEGKKKQPKVAAGKTTGVKEMPESYQQIDERELTKGEAKKKEEYVKGMKKGLSGFKQRYGERAKSVLYATATSMAKKKS